MTTTPTEIGQLIAFGLDPRLSPGRSAEYAALVTRFRTEPAYRNDVELVARGQGLDILDCSPIYGLVLAATSQDSPYFMRLDSYAQMQPDEKYLNALIFLVIATASYPTPESLEAEDGPLPQLTVAQVLQLTNRLADKIRERSRDKDPPVGEPQLEPVYRLVLRWRDGDTTGDERSNPHVKVGIVRRAMKFLADNGLAEEVSTAKDAFRMRSRFRLHVKDAIDFVGPALAHLRALERDCAE